jgi:UDP-N-acetylmuramoyl-tripeptide--D-alanyl-D-alanine ligase
MNRYIKKIIMVLLRLVSQAILWRHKPIVIAITGSVGKTITKDIVAHGLSSVTDVCKSQKNFNTDFGVPLSIIEGENPNGKVLAWFNIILKGISVFLKSEYHKVLVLEVGTRFPGDIARIAKWLRPNISIITHIPEVPVHIEFFESRDHIVDEKSALAKYTKKGGSIILNRDSEYVYAIAENSKHPVVSIGFNLGADVRATNIKRILTNDGQYGLEFIVNCKNKIFPVTVPGFVANHQIYGVLFAIAVADILGYDVEQVGMAMSSLKPTAGRLRPLVGVRNTLILDDSYNASPAAMEAAIETLKMIDVPGSKIAVLGDMLDLGKMTMDVHSQIGTMLKENTDYVFLVGPRMEYAYESAIKSKYLKSRIFHFEKPLDVLPHLEKVMKSGDAILVKGSQGMRMEKLVAELIEDKENIKNLIARQDDEWLKK